MLTFIFLFLIACIFYFIAFMFYMLRRQVSILQKWLSVTGFSILHTMWHDSWCILLRRRAREQEQAWPLVPVLSLLMQTWTINLNHELQCLYLQSEFNSASLLTSLTNGEDQRVPSVSHVLWRHSVNIKIITIAHSP